MKLDNKLKKLITGFCAAGVVLWLGTLFFLPPNTSHLNFVHRFILSSVVIDWEKLINQYDSDDKAIIPLDKLLDELSFWQKPLVNDILKLKPQDLGVTANFVSLEQPSDLTRIPSVFVTAKDGTKRETGVQFLPAAVHNAFEVLSEACKKETGKKLIVDSGYRSPGRQCFLFMYYLVHAYDYSLRENIKWILMPGYSEHGSPKYTAIDITTEEGINGFSNNQKAEDFTGTPEYAWLIKRAGDFGFVLSYPEHNRDGHAFEPWHWHYSGPAKQHSEQTEMK